MQDFVSSSIEHYAILWQNNPFPAFFMEIERKINVLFVLIQLKTGGSERVVLDLARNLDRSLFNVHAAFFSGGQLQGAFGEACRGLFHIHKKKGFDPGAIMQLSKIIQQKHIAVINAHHYMPFFYSYLGSRIFHKRKLIYTEHSVAEVEGISSSFQKWICNTMLYNTSAVIGVSAGITESFKREFPTHSEKVFNISNGVDIRCFAKPTDRDKVRTEWGILPEHFVMGMVANFRKVKNHACLIRAFGRLIKTYPHIRLVLVGRGYPEDTENSEQEINQLIHSYKLENRVILTGYQEDIPSILCLFDVFCLPSFSEGLPVSILEAMAATIPVVGSDVRGIREVISPEVTGLMFPSDNDDALARALERVIENHELRNGLSRNAFSFVCQSHGMKQWVAAYERLFRL